MKFKFLYFENFVWWLIRPYVTDEETAVICTTSGQLLQFSNKQVLDSYDLDDSANEITIFTSYNPVQKFYLVKCKKKLVVVKKTKPMRVSRKFELL